MQERFETFTVLINRISRDIRRIKNQEMAAYHLRSAHVSCLYYIYSLDGVTAAELCVPTCRAPITMIAFPANMRVSIVF